MQSLRGRARRCPGGPARSCEQAEVPTEAEIVTPLSAVETVQSTELPAPDDKSGQIARTYLEALTANRPRASGSENERKSRAIYQRDIYKAGLFPGDNKILGLG